MMFFPLIVCAFVPLILADQLVQVHIVWRHGARYPLANFPTSKSQFPKSQLGQLNPRGYNQHVDLGKWLRSEYVDKHKLLPGKMDPSVMRVRCTASERTKKSAEANFRGMYGQVPHITQPKWDEDEVGFPLKGCRRTRLIMNMLFKSPEWSKAAKSQKGLINQMSSLMGKKIDAQDFSRGMDPIRVQPENGVSVDPRLAALLPQMVKAEASLFKLQYGTGIGWTKGQKMQTELAKAVGGPIMYRVVEEMRKMSKGATKIKYQVFSSHDNILMGVLATLGFGKLDFDRDTIPDYASALIFELWKGSNGHYVKTRYRRGNQVHEATARVSGCGQTCSLQTFIQRSKPYTPQHGVTKFCQRVPTGCGTAQDGKVVANFHNNCGKGKRVNRRGKRKNRRRG